jgi:hypothetical protein
MMPVAPLFNIGVHSVNGHELFLKLDDMKAHALFVGGTRRGKSKFLEHTSRFFLRSKIPHLVLDPAGDTVRDIMAHAVNERLGGRIIYIDLNRAVEDAVFPLNFLQRTSLDTSTHASRVMKAIAKVFREEDAETKPRLERRERATLMALIEAGYTLADMLHFLSVSDNSFRKKVLSGVKDTFVLSEWAEYDAIQRRADREMLLESCLNRAAKIILNEPVRRCLSAPTFGIDWNRVVREGKTILVNLQPRLVSRECMQLVGILLIDHLVNHAVQLQKPMRRPFFVLCDELDELASPDFALSMQALAKRNVYVWGFIQYLEQLKEDKKSSRLYHSAMANCDLKIAFHTSYEDAKLLVRELFAGMFRGDIVKHEISHTLLIPKESVRRVLTRTEMESQTESSSRSTGTSSSQVSMDSTSDGVANGSAVSFDHGMIYGRNTFISSSFQGSSTGAAFGDSTSEQETTGQASTKAKGSSESEIPFYEYVERQELSSRAYYTIEELVEKYIAYIQCQPKRHAQAKLRDNQAVPIITPFIETPRVRSRDIERIIIRSNKLHTLTPQDIDQISMKRLRVLPEPDVSDEIEDDDHWQ